MLGVLIVGILSALAVDSTAAGQETPRQVVRPTPPQAPRPLPPASEPQENLYGNLFKVPASPQADEPVRPRYAGRVVVVGPTFACGMPMVHGNTDIDPKMMVRKPGDHVDYKIREIPAPCR